MPRAERLLELMQRLRHHRLAVTADRLAAELGVGGARCTATSRPCGDWARPLMVKRGWGVVESCHLAGFGLK